MWMTSSDSEESAVNGLEFVMYLKTNLVFSFKLSLFLINPVVYVYSEVNYYDQLYYYVNYGFFYNISKKFLIYCLDDIILFHLFCWLHVLVVNLSNLFKKFVHSIEIYFLRFVYKMNFIGVYMIVW